MTKLALAEIVAVDAETVAGMSREELERFALQAAAMLRELANRARADSTNSSRPPSSDLPWRRGRAAIAAGLSRARLQPSRLPRQTARQLSEQPTPIGMTGMADLIERKSLKLLAQAGQVLNQMVSEGLCDEPQKELMQTMLAELRGMLDEFEEAYFGS